MSSHRAPVRVLTLAVVLALTGCTDGSNRKPATTTTTATTAPPTAATCPLGAGCPRPQVTPGSVIPSEVGVCQASYNPRRELTAAGKVRVLAAYGLAPGTKVAEFDHLIARWAGGESTPSNIWPMVSVAEKQRKDRLEYGLYLALCHDGDQGIAPAKVKAACHSTRLTLECARGMMREYWRWW